MDSFVLRNKEREIRYECREMYNYGYKWTGMIPLTAEEARNLFLNDSIQIYRLYQDNTESSVESLEEISAPYLYVSRNRSVSARRYQLCFA